MFSKSENSEFKICENSKKLEWKNDKKVLSLNFEEKIQAMLDENKQVIVVLKNNINNEKLYIYDINGELKKSINKPSGFDFNYLTKDEKSEVIVICSTENPINDWYDWQFSIDLRRGLLIRKNPSY